MHLELGSDTIIRLGGRRISAPANVLTILEAFAHPISFSKAVKSLSEKIAGAQGWIELVATINRLHKEGVLVDEAGTPPVLGMGWAAPQIHIAMLNDRVRTEAFLSAIADSVRPGDVVVDIGTGTGVLAVAAARAGARHVYAIEASEMGRAAQSVFEANGFADRITLLPGWSTQVQLPEPANVLVAEIIGNDPLEEEVMETFADARKRFLAPDARVIPARVQVYGIPLAISEAVLAEYSFTADSTSKWKNWYGIDFESLQTSSLNRSVVFKSPPHKSRDWPALAAPVLLADLDLTGASHPLVNETAELTITTAGLLNGLLMYFDLEVGPGQRLRTSPAAADETGSWGKRGSYTTADPLKPRQA